MPAALGAAAILAVPAAASARTVVVYPGGPTAWATALQHKTGAGVNNFLINKVVINVGDTVQWDGAGLAGGFHTVDIPARHVKADLPLFVPTAATVSGVNDAANNPFWFDNQNGIPSLGINPGLVTPSGGTTYDGSARVDSGLPVSGPKDFAVKFTKPGTFKYFCDVHYGMGGEVVVKHQHAHIPSAKQNATALKHAEAHFAKLAALALKTKVPKDTVSLGLSKPGGVEIFAMFPASLTVKAGTTVTFAMSQHTREVHSATFGPDSYLGPLEQSLLSPSPDQQLFYPSDPPGTIQVSPTSHGNGYASTGLLDRDSGTPLPPVSKITFNTPGTYNFQCVIHNFMKGVIKVTS